MNESANVNFTVKVLESLDFSAESGFLKKMVRIFEKIGPDVVWILILLVWNLNWRHWVDNTLEHKLSVPPYILSVLILYYISSCIYNVLPPSILSAPHYEVDVELN